MSRLAVVGAGSMGLNHARVARSIGADLIAVVDSDYARAASAASRHEVLGLRSTRDLIGRIDAAIVATPPSTHLEVAAELLSNGIHVLVEKPMALAVDECDELVALAEKYERVLMVGHVERFNPVVVELRNMVEGVIDLSFARIGPFPERIREGVVLDLMIHDLDLARMLVPSKLRSVAARGTSNRGSGCELAHALLIFDNGVTANLSASHLGQQKVRQIAATLPDCYISTDLIRQDIAVHRVSKIELVTEHGPRYRETGVTEIPYVQERGEPLAAELREFLRAIDEGRNAAITGNDGRSAVALALEVERLIRDSL